MSTVGKCAPLVAAAALLAACAGRAGYDEGLAPRLVPGGNGSAQASADLSGTWQLDARESARLAGGDRGGPTYGGRAGLPGSGGYGGRAGGYPGGMPEQRMARDSLPRDSLARDSVMREMGRLVVVQTDTALTFTVGRSAPLLVFTDWRETRIPGRYGPRDVTFVTGSWKGRRFEVRRALPSRTVIVESYEVSNDGARLTVTTRIAERGGERGEILPREGRRVYTRAAQQ